ncbi:hypothetical protein [Streptomyces sp. NPDC058665]|uniref:hypothetical protein n=1 Tax=Streptomyces sp. NPDC058665 TaxID=3346586 RepID=UPI003662E64E
MPKEPFDENDFIRDRAATIRTFEKEYNMGSNKRLMGALETYFEVLEKTGRDLNKGISADEATSKWAADELIDEFNAMRMLDIPAKWLRENAKYYSNRPNSSYQRALDKAADKARHRKALWSKTDTEWAGEEAERRDLVILERTGAGKAFNKKPSGYSKWSDALVMGNLWTGMSTGFVRGALSSVEAFVLEGKTNGSVMANHEVPTLAGMIRQGLVEELHIQIENIDDPSKPPERWTLVAGQTFHVHSRASFDQLPSPATGFPERQQIWYEKENRKASIDEFVAAVGDKNVAILLPRRDAIVPSNVDVLVEIKKNERDRLAHGDHWHLRRLSIKEKKGIHKIYKNEEYQRVLSASLGGRLEFMQALGDSYVPRSKSVSGASESTDQAYYAASGSTGRAYSAPSGSTGQAYYADSGSRGQAYYAASGVQFANVAFSQERTALNHHDTERISPLEGDFADLTVTDEAHAGEAHAGEEYASEQYEGEGYSGEVYAGEGYTAVSGSTGQAYYANFGTGEHRTDERRESRSGTKNHRSNAGYGSTSSSKKRK